ncbi:GDSL esterase/lipase At1g09390-like [Bidens hawaiensis]|uniref:GDSL esterase/lipase At1g09390-like n=1 Tax=Bidens hawaiensis TaxID=980011 RepID=UPI00404A198F
MESSQVALTISYQQTHESDPSNFYAVNLGLRQCRSNSGFPRNHSATPLAQNENDIVLQVPQEEEFQRHYQDGQSVNASFLPAYMESLGSTFSNGANFAVIGSSTLPKYVPFALNIQVMQFLHFKSRSYDLLASGLEQMINNDGFQRALYMIDIGQNDLSDAFANKYTYTQVIKRIPLILAEIKNAIKTTELDPHSCISSYNSAAKLHNEGLHHLCTELRSELKDSTIVYVDIYTIKYELIANASKYGFTSPLMACCGFGGPPYNYNINVTCGHDGAQACDKGSQFIYWDGIHHTEAANSIMASKILSQQYSTPRVPFNIFCQ